MRPNSNVVRKAHRKIDAAVQTIIFGDEVQWSVFGHDVYSRDLEGRSVPHYSTAIQETWFVIEQVNKWTFSNRTKFQAALRAFIAERLFGRNNRHLIAHEEVILKVTPIDICLGALSVKGVDARTINDNFPGMELGREKTRRNNESRTT